MRKPLPPLQAFAEDARHASERTSDATDDLVTWLSVAQSAEQLSILSGSTRDAALQRAERLLATFAHQRPSMCHDVLPAPTDQLGQVAEHLRVAAEAMERAGCFELAFTTVAAVCRMTAHGDYVSASLATVHLGRIARQMNDLVTAQDCYGSMLETSLRERDGPLAARGYIGLALIQDMRGNLPAAEAQYLEALKVAVPMGAAYVAACQGAMTIAISRERLADALLYGWKLHDATAGDVDARAAALSDLSVVALRAGFIDAALKGFEHALSLSQVPRVHMVTLAGAIRAAARRGDVEAVVRYDANLLKDIARANLPHSATLVLLCAAEAWALVGEHGRADDRLAEGVSLARRFGFHEYVFKAEQLASEWQEARARRVPVTNLVLDPAIRCDPDDPYVEDGIHRLEALAR